MNYKAYLDYKNINDLRELVNNLNVKCKLDSRSFTLLENVDGNHELNLIEGIDMLPYGIFQIGCYIGQHWMSKNYRLELGEWQKSVNQVLFKDDYFPTYDKENLSLKNGLLEEFTIKSALKSSNCKLLLFKYNLLPTKFPVK